ncbi:MAG: hypothetical protein ACRDL3_15605 [Solirubrobacterales bacterium]
MALLIVIALGFAPRAEGSIWWSNTFSDSIGRANLDGSGANQSFIAGADDPCGVAVDRSHVYWTNPSSDVATIGRARLNGTKVDQSFITGAASPCGVAADRKHVYWANGGGTTIGRAKLNGNKVDQSFITGAASPCGVAVDGAHVYWGSFGGTTIGRANLDGTGAEQSFITVATGTLLCGLAVDQAHLYWTSRNAPAIGDDLIGRANLDGSVANPSFIGGASRPVGVAVDSGPVGMPGLRFGKVRRNRRRGTATLLARVPEAGRLKLSGAGVKRSKTTVAHSGKVGLRVKAMGHKKRKLARAGRAKVRPKVAYTATGGVTETRRKTIRLIRRR